MLIVSWVIRARWREIRRFLLEFKVFSCLNNLTTIFETLHHDGQIKETITTEKAERVLTYNSLLCFGEYKEPKGIILLTI